MIGENDNIESKIYGREKVSNYKGDTNYKSYWFFPTVMNWKKITIL